MQLQKHLQERWYLYQHSHDAIFDKLDAGWVNFYVWFDPTADSLHLWNLIGFMTAVQLMLKGNKYYALVGWATWMVWDPGWKDSERTFLDIKTLQYNVSSIKKQYDQIISRLEDQTWQKLDYEVVNNIDFYEWLGYLDFLREVWKYHTVNQMMSKDTVKKRIEDPSKSISYTEFSYMLLQGYDYYYLQKNMWVSLQMWWQDQWWNLVTGIELIRKKTDEETYCFTWPLITDATWRKFWKSEGNALFLDRTKTSPYSLYQYFINADDSDLDRYFKLLTLLELNEIKEIVDSHSKLPEQRAWQKRLAYEIVQIIHGKKDAEICVKITEFLFWSGDKLELLKNLSIEEFEVFSLEIGSVEYNDQNLFSLFMESGLEKSWGTARQTLQNWGMFINEQKVEDWKYDFSNDFIDDRFLLIRKWKKSYRIVKK